MYAHLNACADQQRCESESFSTKWSGGRERNKEMCSCQGSGELRLLPEILWKNHTFEGLVLCCLRISSSDQWNKGEKKRGGERERERQSERIRQISAKEFMMNRGLVWTETFWETRENPCFAQKRTEMIIFTITRNVPITQLKERWLIMLSLSESVWVFEECEKYRAQK